MKDYYNKIFDIVVKNGEERLRRKKHIMVRCTRNAFFAAGLCAAIIVGLCIWHNNDLKKTINRNIDNSMIITESTTTAAAVTQTAKPADIAECSQTTTKIQTKASHQPTVVTKINSTADIPQRSQTTTKIYTETSEPPAEIVTTVKIRDVKINAPDVETICSKFNEINLDDDISYKLQYTDINSSTIGTKKQTIEILNFDSSENKRYIVTAEIYDVSVECSENLIAVKYSGSDEIYLYYALTDDKFSMDWVKFSMPFDKYGFGYISCGIQRVNDEKVGEFLGDVNLNGRNDFTDEDISLLGKVYKIENISPDCGVAVMYDNDGEYHLFRNIAYKPETLGQLIYDMDLENEMIINGIYVNDNFYEIDPEMVWELILSEKDAQNYGHGIASCDYTISVDIPILGRKNIAINVYSDGYISTNIPESKAYFNIGKKNAQTFIEYVTQYGVIIEKNKTDSCHPPKRTTILRLMNFHAILRK